MNKKFIIMGAIALFFGSLSIVAADYWLKSNVQTVVKEVQIEAKPVLVQKAAEQTIVVAGEALSYGDAMTRENLREVAWAAEELPAGAFKTIDKFLNEGERSSLGAIELGEPILTSRVTGSGARPSLSTLVAPGMRAMAIRTDVIAGVSGFIVPGDRVDVMLVRQFRSNNQEDTSNNDQAIRAAATPNARSVAGADSQTVVTSQVLANVKVLSIDQIADNRHAEPIVAGSTTIEVTPTQASLVSAAQEAGQLTLHLRRAGDAPTTAQAPENGIDYNPTAAFAANTIEPRKTSRSIRVRLGSETQTHEVQIEGIAQ